MTEAPSLRGLEQVEVASTSPTVSVAMATYNGARFLREQLDSLATQTFLPAELIVSDDGSTDETIEIIENFARTAPFRVRLLPKHERLGFSDNFLHAAEHCRGAYIAFCDQDDSWLPLKLEVQLGRIRQDGSILALHRLIMADESLKPRGEVWDQWLITRDSVFEPLELNPYCTGWGNSMLFKRELLELASRLERPRQPEHRQLPLSHDTWLYVLGAGLGRVSHIMEPLVLYRQHSTSIYGISRPSLSDRIYHAATIPERRFRHEALFHKEMADVFDSIAARESGFSARAARAASISRQRALLCESRLQTYTAEHISARLTAFRLSRSVAFYRPWIGSTIKEFLLGVCGLSGPLKRFVERPGVH